MTQERGGTGRLAFALGAFLAAVYLLTSSPAFYPADDRYYVALARALVERQSVAFPPATSALDGQFVWVGPDGRVYCKFGLGYPAVLAPFYAAARAVVPLAPEPAAPLLVKLGLNACPALLIAAALALGVRVGRRLGYGGAAVAAWAVMIGLATNLWPATKALNSEPAQALALTVLGAALIGPPSRRGALVAGAACGWLVLTKLSWALAVPVIAVALRGAPAGRGARVLAAAGPLAVAVGLQLAYAWVRTGSPFQHGYDRGPDAELGFAHGLIAGLYTLLASPGKSAFLYSPPLVLAVLGARAFAQRHPRACAVIAGLTLPHLAVSAMWWANHGDWAWGPRFVVPLLPLWGLLALPAMARLSRVVLAGVFALGVGVQLLGVVVAHADYHHVFDTIPMAWSTVSPSARAGAFVVDQGYFVHFFPMFSALRGHAWLIARMITGGSPGDHPWAYFGVARLAPAVATPRPDLIWWALPPGPASQVGHGVLALLLGIAALAAARVVRVVRASKDESGQASPLAEASRDESGHAASPAGASMDISGYIESVPAGAWVAVLGALLGLTGPAWFREAPVHGLAVSVAGGLAAWLIARGAAHTGAGRVACWRLMWVALPATMLWARCRGADRWPFAILAMAVLTERVLAGRVRGAVAAVLAGGLAVLCAAGRGAVVGTPLYVSGFLVLASAGKGFFFYNPLVWLGRGAGVLGALAAGPLVVELVVGGGAESGWGPAGLALSAVPLAVAAGRALERITLVRAGVVVVGLALGVASVLVAPAEYVARVARVPGLSPPGSPSFRAGVGDPLIGVEFVPQLSPLGGQVWMAQLALGAEVAAPYERMFRRFAAPREERPRLDFWLAFQAGGAHGLAPLAQ